MSTSVRTRTRLEQLTGEGHYTGGTVAFGYKRVRLGRVNKKNQEVCDLVIDEAEAEIVRLIFHKYVYEGYGAQKLSHYLYEQGVVGRNNKNIPNTSIVRMIKNKCYTGYLINGAVETECPQLRIIEPELFEQAQKLRQARTCERGGTSLGTSSKALLTGLVYCAHCGNRLSLTSSGRTHTYADGHTVKEVRPRYSCFYKIRHPGDCDGQSGYGVSKLDSIVEEVVRQIFAQFREVSRKKLLESLDTKKEIVNPERVYIKPNFTFAEEIVPNEVRSDEEYFLFAGRVEALKGIDIAVRAFEKLPDKKLYVAGNGPMMEEMQRYVREHHMENVKFLGYLQKDEMSEKFYQAKAVIMTSQCYEAFAMTIAEAYSYGVPVIAGRVGNMDGMVQDGITGVKFTYNSAEDLADKISAFDAMDLSVLKKNARAFYAERLRPEDNYQKLIRIYEDISK